MDLKINGCSALPSPVACDVRVFTLVVAPFLIWLSIVSFLLFSYTYIFVPSISNGSLFHSRRKIMSLVAKVSKPDLFLEKDFNEEEGQYYVAYRKMNETTNEYEDAVEYFDNEGDADDFITEIEDCDPDDDDDYEDDDIDDEE